LGSSLEAAVSAQFTVPATFYRMIPIDADHPVVRQDPARSWRSRNPAAILS